MSSAASRENESVLHQELLAAANDEEERNEDAHVAIMRSSGDASTEEELGVSAHRPKDNDDGEQQQHPSSNTQRQENRESSSNKMETFEIEMGRSVESNENELDKLIIGDEQQHRIIASSPNNIESDNNAVIRNSVSADEDELAGGDDDDDMKSLLGRDKATTAAAAAKRKQQTTDGSDNAGDDDDVEGGGRNYCCCCCCDGEKVIRIGNIRVFSPRIYAATGGWGVLGPHWFGPPCVILLLTVASYYFIYECSWKVHRYYTAITCGLFSMGTLYFLLSAAYRNPGIIVQNSLSLPDPIPRTYRWCDTCNYYQPPNAAHCPDCDVCVAGFDHHCVWMGTCIGVGNFKPFIRFNLCWMAYLAYATVWVSVIAPLVQHHRGE